MSIYGIGTDIVNVDRIKHSLKNKKFINRVFNEKEISKCKKINNSINCYAKRFAAKEAFSKALGTGVSNGINLNEIVILNKKSGKPYINIVGQTKKILERKFKRKNQKFHYLLLMKKICSCFCNNINMKKQKIIHSIYDNKNFNRSLSNSYFN